MCDLIKPFDDMIDEQKKFMTDKQNKEYRNKYLGLFVMNGDIEPSETPQKVSRPKESVEVNINMDSKFDTHLLEKQLESIIKRQPRRDGNL